MNDDATNASMAAEAAARLLGEAYFGPSEGATWFTNHGQGAGILATLERLDAKQASRSLRSGGPSVAAHAEHLRWSLERVRRTLDGHPWEPDWAGSWGVQRVSEEDWKRLREGLHQAVEAVLARLDRVGDWPNPLMLTGVLATAPHAAHHLGTIREMERQLSDHHP